MYLLYDCLKVSQYTFFNGDAIYVSKYDPSNGLRIFVSNHTKVSWRTICTRCMVIYMLGEEKAVYLDPLASRCCESNSDLYHRVLRSMVLITCL